MRRRAAWTATPRGCLPACCAKACAPTTWFTAPTRRSSRRRVAPARERATAWACSSNRRPRRFSSGAACGRTRPPCCARCVRASRAPSWRVAVILWKGFCYALGALVAAFCIAQVWFFAHVLMWSRFEPSSTAFMSARLAQMREQDPAARLQRQWVPYERISVHLKRAVVAAEDAKFLDHEGFDWEAIVQARAKNESHGRIVAGASTISQQLAKNLFLSSERSWL